MSTLLNFQNYFHKTGRKWSIPNYWCFQKINRENCSILPASDDW